VTDGPAAAAPPPLLELRGIHKRFPGVHALDGVDLDLLPGEVHALLGENGAGKSTLLKIISGAVPKDAGEIRLDGHRVELRHVVHARALGIGMVHQELSLIRSLSVAENVVLGSWPRRPGGLVDWAAVRRRAEEVLAALGVPLDPRVPVGRLSLAEQQLVEIARVLSLRVRILLLDEPTSALAERERDRLFEVIDGLRRQGVAVVYTSHRLGEVFRIGDRVTVLRDGRKIGTLPARQADEDLLVRMMVGRELHERFPKTAAEVGASVLEVRDLSAGALRGVSLVVRRGELVGVFGLRGAGRTTLARALFGLQPVAAGSILVDGLPVRPRSPADAIRAGIGYLTEDRRQGLVTLLPVVPNITLATLRAFVRWGVLDGQAERRTADHYVRALNIHPPLLGRRVLYFSGGNQQKIAFAKWLCGRPRVLILDEPTRGIDVGAKSEVFRLIGQLAQQGVGILLLSSELPELLAVADRIVVLRGGQVSGEFHRGEATQERLLRAATVLSAAEAAQAG